MSQWRREASKQLPEFQRIIASRDVDNPMMLWILLGLEFDRLCEQNPPLLGLLRRIWWYAKWCLKHPNGDVHTAAAIGFCEGLLSSSRQAQLLPQILVRDDLLGLREFILYHLSPEEFDWWLRELWPTD